MRAQFTFIRQVPGARSNLANGTSYSGYNVKTCWKVLRDGIGQPLAKASGDGKVTNQWVIMSGGAVFTIYDYKATKKYHRAGLTQKALREKRDYEWHIGTNCRDENIRAQFFDWLQERVGWAGVVEKEKSYAEKCKAEV
jgi:hypothetical protein